MIPPMWGGKVTLPPCNYFTSLQSACLSVCLSVCLCVCIYFYLSVSVCASVCQIQNMFSYLKQWNTWGKITYLAFLWEVMGGQNF